MSHWDNQRLFYDVWRLDKKMNNGLVIWYKYNKIESD